MISRIKYKKHRRETFPLFSLVTTQEEVLVKMKCLTIFALVCVAFAAADLFDEDGSGDLTVSCSCRHLLV